MPESQRSLVDLKKLFVAVLAVYNERSRAVSLQRLAVFVELGGVAYMERYPSHSKRYNSFEVLHSVFKPLQQGFCRRPEIYHSPEAFNDLNERVRGLLESREERYLELADIVITIADEDIPEICNRIIKRL